MWRFKKHLQSFTYWLQKRKRERILDYLTDIEMKLLFGDDYKNYKEQIPKK